MFVRQYEDGPTACLVYKVTGRVGITAFDSGQPISGSIVQWREMKNFRRKRIPQTGGARRTTRGELPLYSANLGSPIFVESWNGGSPLNWVEFMGRWEITRVDRKTPESDD